MKKIIRLTESDLHKIVKESVKKILKEGVPDPSDFLDQDPYYDEEENEDDPLDDYNNWRLENLDDLEDDDLEDI